MLTSGWWFTAKNPLVWSSFQWPYYFFATETDPSSQPIPEQNSENLYNDLVPSCILIPSHINKHPVQNALLTLMDLGSSFTLIHHSKLPPGCVPEWMLNVQESQTAAGNFHFSQCVCLTDSQFPEFSCALHINSNCNYPTLRSNLYHWWYKLTHLTCINWYKFL